ncbi:MAG: isoprenylcysteine carboxylmethyltransferase family protein [Burkholderiales bacterium]|nr:isoprenylcysteine carboxylmethyltransferase family protein [Burkholderiales bacterium]
MRWIELRPPLLAPTLGLAAHGLHLALWGTAAPLGRWPVAGTALVLAGLGWMVWAAWCLRQARTPLRPTGRPRVLVDEGPYRFGRHPMYLGMTAAIVGAALALGSPLLMLAALAFASIVARVHVPHEEQRLRQVFGGWYSDYAASVRRWF